jgi:hypothetical protein
VSGDWDEDKHPRDDRGRFGSGLAKWARSKAGLQKATRGLVEQIQKNPGGFSWRPDTGNATTGVMVAEHPDAELGAAFKPESKEHLIRELKSYVRRAASKVASDPDFHFGGWESKGVIYLDVSKRYPKERESDAHAAGRQNNQIAVFSLDRREEIQTGGTGEKTRHK